MVCISEHINEDHPPIVFVLNKYGIDNPESTEIFTNAIFANSYSAVELCNTSFWDWSGSLPEDHTTIHRVQRAFGAWLHDDGKITLLFRTNETVKGLAQNLIRLDISNPITKTPPFIIVPDIETPYIEHNCVIAMQIDTWGQSLDLRANIDAMFSCDSFQEYVERIEKGRDRNIDIEWLYDTAYKLPILEGDAMPVSAFGNISECHFSGMLLLKKQLQQNIYEADLCVHGTVVKPSVGMEVRRTMNWTVNGVNNSESCLVATILKI